MKKRLMTPFLVIKYSGLYLTFPLCDFSIIDLYEEYEMRECLGEDFYKDMLDDLFDYSDTEEYDVQQDYIIGDTVFFDGQAFKAIAASQGIEPLNTDYWELGKKFNSDCYEHFFCNYLVYYLALIILRHRLPFIRTKIEGRGTIQYDSQDFKTSDRKDYDTLDASILKHIQISQSNMINYLNKNKTNECFLNYIGFGCSGCGNIKCDCNKEHQGHEYLFA